MNIISKYSTNYLIIFGVAILLITGNVILNSINPALYPSYYLYIVAALVIFLVLSSIDFDIFTLFSKHLYIVSVILLLLPLVLGQVTRGTVRWIPLGPVNIQPSEVIRPFLLVYFAQVLTTNKINWRNILKSLLILGIPFTLIAIQPSLGVGIITASGFFGALLASQLPKKYIIAAIFICIGLLPLFWLFLADYQKQRVMTFVDPFIDPRGSGYNSIQSMISVGSGKIFGRGLGQGVQTQLKFLPERHTDFIFAATAEELGFVGSVILLLGLLLILLGLISILENAQNPTARAYISAVFFVILIETVIHVGMNIGLLPITGVPLPFVSAGGSALIGTVASLAIAVTARKSK